MSTFEKGTRVRVNDIYAAGYKDTDGTIHATVGEAGTVTKYDAWYVEVRLDNEELHMTWGVHLFVPSELDVLEEAHPLQKEFTNS